MNGGENDLWGVQILQLLRSQQRSLVLAESCTAGLISAMLARSPGMSECLCGGFVVYQTVSKQVWLGVSPDLIVTHDVVSGEVAAAMASGALAQTPHADLALAITGHLGPGAPAELDGTAWLAITDRAGKKLVLQLQLTRDDHAAGTALRQQRQRQSATLALQHLLEFLADTCDPGEGP
jgi:nicotinamide-nucleotide amidase